jgi:malonyl-CoA/methylmalonyl-CoA synthetase
MLRPSPLLARWKRHANRDEPAILDAAGNHTYREIDAGARRVAAWLLHDRPGSSPSNKKTLNGERVALLLEPNAEFVEAFFGVLFAGGCVVVLSPLHPAAELAYFADDARVRTVLASPGPLAEKAFADLPGRNVIQLTSPRSNETLASDVGPGASQDDPALQLYTSGTTGKPKGAVLTHENLGIQQVLLGEAWGWSEMDRLLHALPLHHLHGLGIALLTALGAGASAHLLSFDAAAVWNAMGTGTVFMAVPTMYAKLFAAFDAADIKTRARWSRLARGLRLATSGSAALPVTLGERWRAITGRYPLERFGMTEIGVGMSNPLHGERRPGWVGQPLRTVETRIVGEHGEEAAEGELWVRGPSVFHTYFERPKETAAAFVQDEHGGAPWFRTGDTVTRDATKNFRILGRTSVDILKSGGYKLSALEIEEVLRDHPAIAEVAVIGLPDPTWGDRVVACIVARPGLGEQCEQQAVRAFAKERLAPYKVPKEVVLLERLPRNAVGKVIKPELAKWIDRSKGGLSP